MLTDLRLQHFRSYTDASFEIAPGVNIIVGPNASGKTNLLEAVLMVARGSSYRAKDGELIQHGKDWARLDANLPEGRRAVKLMQNDTISKTFEIDDRTYQRLPYQQTMPVILFEPDHLTLLSGSPDLRRNFLDDLIEQTTPGFGATRRHYKRVLSQRNSLLKKNPRDLREQLFVWNVRLSELGGRIARERHKLTAAFHEQASELYSALAQRQSDVVLAYTSAFDPPTYESALLKKLESSIDLDVLRGFTAHGPHRDDIAVHIGGHPAQESASRGEARTLVLALKILELNLVESIRQTTPLLLLDDVFSELDGKRRAALTQFVQNYQTFITTTDADIVVQHFSGSNIIPISSD
jgi:DNA replication and repair protein RecF